MKLNVSMADIVGMPNAVIELTHENMAILLASEPDAAKARE